MPAPLSSVAICMDHMTPQKSRLHHRDRTPPARPQTCPWLNLQRARSRASKFSKPAVCRHAASTALSRDLNWRACVAGIVSSETETAGDSDSIRCFAPGKSARLSDQGGQRNVAPDVVLDPRPVEWPQGRVRAPKTQLGIRYRRPQRTKIIGPVILRNPESKT